MAITKLYHGLLSGLNWPRCSRVALLRGFSTDCSYHNRIVERATACSKHTSHDDGVKYLSQFVDGGFDATRLRQFLPSDEGPSSSPLTIDDYLTILETCKLLKLHDMELVSTLSEDLRLAFVTLYKPKKRGRTRPPNAGDSSSRRLDSHIPKRPFQLDTSCAPPLKDVVLDANIDRLNIIGTNTSYKKFRTTKFTEKVSQHLEKLRIRHETNVYFNGILLDIMEKDRNLVWLCNSYHRFYAGSFEPTAESRTLDRLIRDFGFKTCHINYYQWGRLKARRTRFAYIRMARYYALHDHREYDHRYAGWSLPYLWWNASRQDQMHISNYIKYDP
ncbi:hypothetical protein BaOVIS_011660 [Babesia ovis]|uniref:RAP domain-containing protein n=1 Tax=Babesia ovis TaxID=5869 RepID=A0A9W5TC67_BABOV|nr:hypothetical protein BaOVIS_011660 [Babesia ovis]